MIKAFVAKYPFAAAFLAGAVVLTVLPFAQKLFLTAPAPIASLGRWELVDEAGKPFGSVDLRGKVYIASFFSTQQGPQPEFDVKAMLPHLADLDGKAGVAPIAFVSFTVDPEHDTPEALDAFGKELGAPRGKWKLLTGSPALVEDVLVGRFVPALKNGAAPVKTMRDLARASKLALVDQNGDVRGFWDTDELARGNLINAARLLAKAGPRP